GLLGSGVVATDSAATSALAGDGGAGVGDGGGDCAVGESVGTTGPGSGAESSAAVCVRSSREGESDALDEVVGPRGGGGCCLQPAEGEWSSATKSGRAGPGSAHRLEDGSGHRGLRRDGRQGAGDGAREGTGARQGVVGAAFRGIELATVVGPD